MKECVMKSEEKECGFVGNNLVSHVCLNGPNDKAQEDTRRLGTRSLGMMLFKPPESRN